jgi:DNA-binding beta-propeller fold protein YncE
MSPQLISSTKCLAIAKIAWTLLQCILLSGTLAGCGTSGTITNPPTGPVGGPPAPAPELAYAVNSANNTVSVFAVNTGTGAWTPQGSTATGLTPQSVILHPSGNFLYVGDSGEAKISVYSLDAATGLPSPIPSSPFSSNPSPLAMAMDAGGDTLCVASYVVNSNNTISCFSANSGSGALTPIPQNHNGTQPVATNVELAFDPVSGVLFMADIGGVDVFGVNAVSGASLSAGSPFMIGSGSQPWGVTVHPTKKFVFVTSDGAYVASFVESNVLTGAPGSPYAAGIMPGPLLVEPKGNFLYVLNRDGFNISAYSIDSTTGGLTQLQASPFPTGNAPMTIAVEPTGNFLYVANSGDNNISIFMIQANGTLTSLGTMTASGGATSAIAFRPARP